MEDNSNTQTPSTQNPGAQQPVAYDVDGNPLYAAPTTQAQSPAPSNSGPQVVHMSRAVEPATVDISPETKRRHEESVKQYPGLNLSEYEYVVSAVRRHPIGMMAPLLTTGLAVAVVFILAFNYPSFAEVMSLPGNLYGIVLLCGVLFAALFAIGGYLAIWVYMNNWFFLTNESVIQEIQTSIFSRKEQTVSLMNIEDASFSQHGPIQSLLNYGSIRLSTEGDETTYRFDYVSNPRNEIAVLNNAVESFKNGRPNETPAEVNDRN